MMNYIKQIKEFKAFIAEFQMETKSNSVLELTTWYENRMALAEQEDKKRRR